MRFMSRDAWQRGWMKGKRTLLWIMGRAASPRQQAPLKVWPVSGLTTTPLRLPARFSRAVASKPASRTRDENAVRGESLTVAGAAQVDVRSTNRKERALLPV
ncbi:hypothetical protein BG60_04125 [Caballeronia zhejiangensis]|jgi:hypothetical protein|uniref:Uncharacterized protein n=1 Tax=Caballeronia zhejiangensis TaxID=871203 RepID=A0A656QPB7_9BURK|nr:hypothetical protein BG60_04125 [Caballeronia zhejiangensis]